MPRCVICLTDYAEYLHTRGADKSKINCPKCGRYDVERSIARNYEQSLSATQRANLSGWLRHQPPIPALSNDNFDQLKTLRTPTVAEKARTLFNYLCNKYPVAGRQLSELWVPMFEVGSSQEKRENIYKVSGNIEGLCSLVDREELKYIVNSYLTEEQKLLVDKEGQYYVTPAGWRYFDDNPFPASDVAFIAMSFSDEFDQFYKETVVPAVKRAGWNPLRIKEKRHNNYITDVILSGIRRSRFVIADFTENCEGAYFEAGYARGLGLPVIHSVHEDYLDPEITVKKLHFDTLQIYHLPWKSDDHTANAEKLYHHIIATIGIGPIQHAERD